ncbi:MAG: hypothetical protein QOF29_2396 [bacterium]|jgi:hypothetical protein
MTTTSSSAHWWLNGQGVDAWFIHVLFAGDRTHKPSSALELEAAMQLASAEIGLDGRAVPRVGHIVVDALA